MQWALEPLVDAEEHRNPEALRALALDVNLRAAPPLQQDAQPTSALQAMRMRAPGVAAIISKLKTREPAPGTVQAAVAAKSSEELMSAYRAKLLLEAYGDHLQEDDVSRHELVTELLRQPPKGVELTAEMQLAAQSPWPSGRESAHALFGWRLLGDEHWGASSPSQRYNVMLHVDRVEGFKMRRDASKMRPGRTVRPGEPFHVCPRCHMEFAATVDPTGRVMHTDRSHCPWAGQQLQPCRGAAGPPSSPRLRAAEEQQWPQRRTGHPWPETYVWSGRAQRHSKT